MFIYLVAQVYLFGCGMWDLVPWPGIEPGSPALGAQSLSHWTTREVPGLLSFFFRLRRFSASVTSQCDLETLMNMNHSSSVCHLPQIVFDGVLFYSSTDNMDWVSMIDMSYLGFRLPKIGGERAGAMDHH